MTKLTTDLSNSVPKSLVELITLGQTLTKRAVDVLAHFNRPGTSNGPTEALNGRLEHLRASALGFRNLTNCIARSLLVSLPMPNHFLSRQVISELSSPGPKDQRFLNNCC